MKRHVKAVVALILCVMMIVPVVSGAFVFAVAPAKVTGLTLATNSATKQKISWNKVSGATGYILYKYDADKGYYARVSSTGNNYYTVMNLTEGKTYYYKVRAYSGSGTVNDLGTLSATLTANTLGTPGNLRLYQCSQTWQTIKWNKTVNTDGYIVYMYSSGEWKYVAKTTSDAYKITGLTAGKDYSYKVCSYVTRGGAYNVGTRTATLTVTTAPNSVGTVSVSNIKANSATLSWTKSPGASGYQIQLYDLSQHAYKVVANVTTNKYTLTGLEPMTAVSVLVKAYAARNNTVFSGASKAEFLTPPGKVKGIGSVSSGNAITFKWDAVDGAAGYQVYSYNYANSTWTHVQSGSKTSYSVKGLSAGSKVKIMVRAYASSGSKAYFGEYSNTYTSAIAPSAPQNLAAALNSSDGISLSWSAVTGASGYQVFRYNAHDGTWDKLTVTASTKYNDNSVSETSEYTYRVRAYIAGTDTIYYGELSHSVSIDYTSPESPKDNNIISAALEDKGFLSYLYDPKGNYYYTASDPWQRSIGYSSLFDTLAPAVIMWYDTMRLKFTYKDLDWMVQIWKGQYGWVFKGAEIGVYTKPTSRDFDYYDCANDDNMLKMSFDFYYLGKHRFSRDYGYYWWCTGFVPGTNYIYHDLISLDIRITMKDYAMLEGFCAALEGQGYSKSKYTVKGLDVYFRY